MKTALFLPLLLAAAATQAATYWHPDAEAVRFAGPNGAEVCQWYSPGTTTSFAGDTWECEFVYTDGAKNPAEVELQSNGPVKVIGARWSYAYDGQSWVPMTKD